MLIHALIGQFVEGFARSTDHDTVPWFDPEGEDTGPLEHLTPETIWRYEGRELR